MSIRRIVLFGGTFDPVHLGHTTVAEAAAQQLAAEKVIFVPAKVSPLKGFLPFASDEDRLRMLERALAGKARCAVSDCELRRTAREQDQGPLTPRQKKERKGKIWIIIFKKYLKKNLNHFKINQQ